MQWNYFMWKLGNLFIPHGGVCKNDRIAFILVTLITSIWETVICTPKTSLKKKFGPYILSTDWSWAYTQLQGFLLCRIGIQNILFLFVMIDPQITCYLYSVIVNAFVLPCVLLLLYGRLCIGLAANCLEWHRKSKRRPVVYKIAHYFIDSFWSWLSSYSCSAICSTIFCAT